MCVVISDGVMALIVVSFAFCSKVANQLYKRLIQPPNVSWGQKTIPNLETVAGEANDKSCVSKIIFILSVI